MNALKRLRTRIDDTAMAINDHDYGRALACVLYHGTRGAWMAFAGSATTALAFNRRRAAGPLAVLAATAGTAQMLLEAAHSIAVAYPGHPCSRCPQPDDNDEHGDEDGGTWNRGSVDIPPAPTPMPDYDDEQYRAMTGDLDAQLADLIASTRRARTGEAP